MPTQIIRRKLRKKPGVDGERTHWADSQKYEAVSTYLMVGNWPVVSDATGIPIDTLKKWKQQDWWKDYEREVRLSRNVKASSSLSKIVERAAVHLEDRLENGDIVFTRDGTALRKPIRGKELSDIMVRSIDKQILLDKMLEVPEVKEEAVMDRLKNIEEALKRAVNITPKQTEIIDVIPLVEDKPLE